MTHLIVCREYPPAPYPAGGIGTYVQHISQLLAGAGETVHLIAQRWDGAPARVSESLNGKLIVHRVSLTEPVVDSSESARVLRCLALSDCPSQVFAWQAAQIAESLIESEPIDVIEGQEWEFPLYYLQVRRALGLGPRKEPPFLVHLHSPSELIFRFNEWDKTFTDYLPLIRFEEYTIRAADALICPSHYLARGARELYNLAAGDIEVIPYPMGNTPPIPRAPHVWECNNICYVGRLELRKGLVEWVNAAVRVAASHASVTFEFTGSDTSLDGGMGTSAEEFLISLIPRNLRARFQFRGSRSRAELTEALAGVSVIAVPSRWDNLPFTCIEAMSTGLPVLASPNGGMAELITDDESGWLSPDSTASGLESALRRALNTSPARRAEMGARAAEAIHRICGNDVILSRHLELRRRLAEAGARKSVHIPQSDRERRGLGIAVTCLEQPELLAGCLDTINDQTLPARITVIVVHERFRNAAVISELIKRYTVVYTSSDSAEAARSNGTEALLAADPRLRAIAVFCEAARLAENYVSACESAFELHPNLGVFSPWIFREGQPGELDSGPCPISVHQFSSAESLKCAAIRTEALTNFAHGGWAGLTYPGLLVSLVPLVNAAVRPKRRFSVMLLAQQGSNNLLIKWFIAASWTQRVKWAKRTLMHPRRIARRIFR